MLNFEKGDLVQIINTHLLKDEGIESDDYEGKIGVVININKGWEYPYNIFFLDQRIEKKQKAMGGLLWNSQNMHPIEIDTAYLYEEKK